MMDERATTPPQWLYWLTLVLVFIAPGQSLQYAVDAKHGPFIAVADVVAVLAVAAFVVWALLAGQMRRLTWAPAQVWALLVVAVLSALGAESLKDAALEIIQIGLYFVAAYMLFVNVLTDDSRRRGAVWTLLSATSLVVLYGLVQYSATADPLVVKSTFQSRHAYSGFLCTVLPLLFGLVMWTDRRWERYWSGAVILLGALTMVAPALVLVLALVLLITALNWGRFALAGGFLLVLVAFLVMTFMVAPLNRKAFGELVNPLEEGPVYKLMEGEGATEEDQPPIIKKRWIEWMPALNMMAENFMLGVGAGNYQLNIGMPQYYGFLPNVKKSEADTNNLYLVVGSTMGFAGLVCLIAYMGSFWRLSSRLWMHAETPWARGLACGLYAAALALLLTNLLASVLVRGTGLVWALIYALIASKAIGGRTGGREPAELTAG